MSDVTKELQGYVNELKGLSNDLKGLPEQYNGLKSKAEETEQKMAALAQSVQSLMDRKEMAGAGGWGLGTGGESHCFLGAEFQIGKMRKFWR